ncbi:F-box protein At2g26160-like [Rhodamnia argentea]|uniref:F-box protein At2g26160-like n=1 Tax=Rhodamnia argentea TaxID=178133 RepID=A0A8B8N4Y3_9MYRT|nr:F-box protein At2g26160-like [Rhodamnia argentea]
MAKNWADLLPELLELCSRQLPLEDWFAFRSVCSTWLVAASEKRFHVPWLMLADNRSTKSEWAEFYSLFSSRIHKVVLPEVKGKRCLSSRGWIFTIGLDLQIHMLNPLSRPANRDIIKLPSVNKLFDWDPQYYEPETRYTKFVLSASPASSPNYMVIVMLIYVYSKRLGLWKPGTEEWKVLTWPADQVHNVIVLDAIHYKGKFVVLNGADDIVVCDAGGPAPTAQVIIKKPLEFRDHLEFCVHQYLVESAGRLLLVARLAQLDGGTKGFRVFSIDLEARKWTELESMGNASLFVGFSSSFSVQVDENQQAIKANCIYFTKDVPYRDNEGKEVGIYHVQDGRIEWFFDEKFNNYFSRPLWIELDGALYRSDHKLKKDY